MQKANLKFVEVVDLKQYIGEGSFYSIYYWYHVTLKAKDGEKVNFYKARILEFWEKKELKKFKLVGDAPVYSANKLISFILIMTNC